ncbi:MAG: hypothetical protein MAG451_01578 [Anaerolineales bacterium]|nr:hypothetical protein [Anaerolineales bacterium]
MGQPKSYICDMDGVLVSGSNIIPGADQFIQRLVDRWERDERTLPLAARFADEWNGVFSITGVRGRCHAPGASGRPSRLGSRV